MDSVQTVDALPVLDPRGYIRIPKIPDGRVLVLVGTPWQNMEAEALAAVLIMACAEAGQWQPISAASIHKGLRRHSNNWNASSALGIGLPKLQEQGDIEVVLLGDMQYVIPRPTFAAKALGSDRQIRYVKSYAEQPTEPLPLPVPARPRKQLHSEISRVTGRRWRWPWR